MKLVYMVLLAIMLVLPTTALAHIESGCNEEAPRGTFIVHCHNANVNVALIVGVAVVAALGLYWIISSTDTTESTTEDLFGEKNSQSFAQVQMMQDIHTGESVGVGLGFDF